MYSVVLFQNSGFNAVNIPDSPELLNSVARVEVDGVEILQQRFLTSVNVRAKWETVENVDYAKIGDFYYFVTGVAMLSAETAQLALTPDFITSAGGIKDNSNLVILDGVTERQTVSDDSWGAYSEDDPFTQPQQPLILETTWGDAPEQETNPLTAFAPDGDPVFLETTLDLIKQATNAEGLTYSDTLTNETVTVPKTYGVGSNDTKFDLSFGEGDETAISNGTAIYCENATVKVTDEAKSGQESIADGIAQARALGIEGGIINQWRVPAKFIDKISMAVTGGVADASGNIYTNPRLRSVTGRKGTCSIENEPIISYSTPKNNRCLYGEYNRYGIMTAAGNSAEFKPEEITNSADALPTVSFRADPRHSGKPYYRFTTINNDSEFWRNCLAGEEWSNVPFIYQGASGTALNRINFENEQSLATRNYYNAVAQRGLDFNSQYAGIANQQALLEDDKYLGLVGRLVSAFVTGVTGASGNQVALMSSTANQGVSAGTWSANLQVNKAYLEQQQNNLQQSYQAGNDFLYNTYSIQRANELSGLYQANTIWTPTVVFPYNASIIRDVKGNGFLLYKYRYSDSDLARIDKLLTMYGYKETEPLTKANFNRRAKFDYVACSSVTVSGFPRWFNEGIATQLKVGVRVWHVLPTVSAYSDNPINS